MLPMCKTCGEPAVVLLLLDSLHEWSGEEPTEIQYHVAVCHAHREDAITSMREALDDVIATMELYAMPPSETVSPRP